MLTTPEDLCSVIDAAAARDALGYGGRIVTEVFEDPDNVEAIRGLCQYRAPDAVKVEGAMAEVTVPGRGPDLEGYRAALTKAGLTYQDLIVIGADDALWIDHHHTALVRYGDSVGLAGNIGTNSMEPAGLVRLAAMAAKAGRN
ncbi:hypothetical protein WHI96_14545 [Pseudonocardia tropica]|uniref:Uncharacterized protein n=1 Tax=Pseudonocardia tropica TaxID=681289 RepID=A0ABV1JVU2_9PSEU